jgi:hypothetical protein
MYKLLIVSLITAVLSGCTLFASPVLEVVNLAGTAATGVATMAKDKPANPVVFEHEPIKDICIELNSAVPLSEFVPSLQGELKRHGVPSRVYDPGTQPGNCPMTLVYTAAIKWDVKMFAENYSAYMTYASITLRKDGRVVGSAQYRIGRMGQDKWSSIGSKLGPLVDALLISNPEVEVAKMVPEKKDPTFNGS